MFQTHKKRIIALGIIVGIILLGVVYSKIGDHSISPIKENGSQGDSNAAKEMTPEEVTKAAMEELQKRPVPSDPNEMVENIIKDADKDADGIIEDTENAETDVIQTDIDKINTINQTYDENNL